MTDSSDPTEDYKVGYGRPPREHMQKAGAPSKNPYGRKGKPQNREAIARRKLPLGLDETLLKARVAGAKCERWMARRPSPPRSCWLSGF